LASPFKLKAMGKMPKFMIAENPMAEKAQGRLFVLHTQDPMILAEVFEFAAEDEANQMKCKTTFTIGSAVDMTDYDGTYHVLGALWVVEGKKLAGLPAQAVADKLAAVMSAMGDWYYAFRKWEDDTYGNED